MKRADLSAATILLVEIDAPPRQIDAILAALVGRRRVTYAVPETPLGDGRPVIVAAESPRKSGTRSAIPATTGNVAGAAEARRRGGRSG